MLGEGWLTLLTVFWFGGLFCFGGCFGKTVYKLIFCSFGILKQKKKTQTFGNCTNCVLLDRAVLTDEDAAAWKGLCWGLPLAMYKPTLLPALCFLHQTAWWNICTWVVHFWGVQGSLDTPLRFYVYSTPCSLTCPLWKAYVHNTRPVHLTPGHLVGTLGILPWAWLMTISISSVCFGFLFLYFLDYKPCIWFSGVWDSHVTLTGNTVLAY